MTAVAALAQPAHSPAKARAGWPDAPFLALDLDAFERNVKHLADTIVVQGGKAWRPHTKALRSPEIAKRLMAAGAHGVTCATAWEAQTMVDAGIHDVLIASQVTSASAVQAVAQMNRNARVMPAVDSSAHLALLNAAAVAARTVVPVVIEVDIGLYRAGVAPGNATVALARHVLDFPQLRFLGLMAWEGQTTRITDPVAKLAAVRASVALLTGTAQLCREAGLPLDIVSCGGTGTYPMTSRIDGVTELQAGGGVFGNVRYREDFGMPLQPALTLMATVLSRPSARRVVTDAGWKYHGYHPKPSQPLGLPGPAQLAYSAEHLTLDCSVDVDAYAVGDWIEFAVGYADSTVFLHSELIAMRNGAVEEVLALPARRMQ